MKRLGIVPLKFLSSSHHVVVRRYHYWRRALFRCIPHVCFFSLSTTACSLRSRKEIDGIVYEVDCQMITVKAGADVDIGGTLISITCPHKLTYLSRRQPLC